MIISLNISYIRYIEKLLKGNVLLINLLKKGFSNIFLVSKSTQAYKYPEVKVEDMLEEDSKAINDDFINAIMNYESQ